MVCTYRGSLTSFCVYGIASIGPGGITPIKLALAGASISAILSSLVSLIILPRTDVMDAYRFWQVGSLSGATWEGIKSVLPFIYSRINYKCYIYACIKCISLR